jgi:RNase H-fold protein (predicted Holliday junction resolvase)
VPVEMVDERLTSWEAERLLEEQGGRVLKTAKRVASGRDAEKQQRKFKADGKLTVDALAAAVMLKEYLER